MDGPRRARPASAALIGSHLHCDGRAVADAAFLFFAQHAPPRAHAHEKLQSTVITTALALLNMHFAQNYLNKAHEFFMNAANNAYWILTKLQMSSCLCWDSTHALMTPRYSSAPRSIALSHPCCYQMKFNCAGELKSEAPTRGSRRQGRPTPHGRQTPFRTGLSPPPTLNLTP